MASGYWHVADSQSGYTAITVQALRLLQLDRLYKRYGFPNHLLVELNNYDFRVRDVPIRPVYNIGEVSGIHVAHDARTKEVNMLVEMRIYPERLRSRVVGAVPDPKEYRAILNEMVAHGLRAQLKSGNMLTGQLIVALDFFPNAPKAKVNWATNPPQFPTTPGSLVELQATLMQIAKKLEKLPLDEVANDVRQTVQTLDATLKDADRMIRKVDKDVLPEIGMTLEEARKTLGAAKQTLSADAPLQQDLRETLRELARTAQSLRVLTDYLERHPESLIRGKQEDKP
jgi:paraquat-inducible protein B